MSNTPSAKADTATVESGKRGKNWNLGTFDSEYARGLSMYYTSILTILVNPSGRIDEEESTSLFPL